MAAASLAVAVALALSIPAADGGAAGPAPLLHRCYDWTSIDHVLHDPIEIVGNGNFTGANGVVGGDGTPGNPYRISGWLIWPQEADGIVVANTDAFFVVEDVLVCGGARATPPRDGIKLTNVTNASIRDSELPHNQVAIRVTDASNVTITEVWTYRGYPVREGSYVAGIEVVNSSEVVISGLQTYSDYPRIPLGIQATRSRNVSIAGANLDGVEAAIRFEDSTGITIRASKVPSATAPNYLGAIQGYRSSNVTLRSNFLAWGPGAYLTDSKDVLAVGNRFDSTCDGLVLQRVTNATVLGNEFGGSGSCGGIGIVQSDGVVVAQNKLATNYLGMRVSRSRDVRVYHNVFAVQGWGISQQATDDGGAENQWDAGYPDGGNYWFDYDGEDRFSGPGQDQPGSDGFGDTPYGIDSDTFDRYPLMAPDLWNGSVGNPQPPVMPVPTGRPTGDSADVPIVPVSSRVPRGREDGAWASAETGSRFDRPKD